VTTLLISIWAPYGLTGELCPVMRCPDGAWAGIRTGPRWGGRVLGLWSRGIGFVPRAPAVGCRAWAESFAASGSEEFRGELLVPESGSPPRFSRLPYRSPVFSRSLYKISIDYRNRYRTSPLTDGD